MAATIILLRNVLTHLYLTYSLGIISFDNFKNFPSNFHLYDDGPHRNLQVFNDSDLKLLHVPSFGCRQNFTLNSTGSEVYTETQFSVGVKLYIADENNTRHYLRVNAAKDFAFELVCQDYVRNVTESGNPWFRQELEFDLVTVNIDDILDNVQDLSGSGSVE